MQAGFENSAPDHSPHSALIKRQIVMAQGHVFTGTSGWSYDHWSGSFYPDGLPHKDWLVYYARHLHSLEINNSFYHLPDKKVLQQWYETVPDNFVFTAKASRYITHMKKLKDPKTSVAAFFDRISVLDDKLGPIIFQLPPHWGFNPQRLEEFLCILSTDYRYAFEFRDHSWHNSQTLDLLKKYNAAFCIYELDGFLSERDVTTDFVYVRLHGPNGAYQGCYDSRTLAGWAGAFSTWSAQGRDIYCYFDNDEEGYAARNALTLQSMLEK